MIFPRNFLYDLSHYRSKNNNNNNSSLAGENNNNNVNKKSLPFETLTLKIELPSTCEMMNLDSSEEPKSPEMPSSDKPVVKRLIDNPLIPVGLLVPEGVTIAPVTATPDHDRDIAIVNNFFSNQLWKPEYIGAYS
ncbi:hypothetical protein NQ314_004987 [Rhamnusium bicolor]|uniref:Uncharacterized protein n=1 Tax=Rhamnusium bicolor TaxID=1586634 RepID=A0AAV8ZKL8_9CUCU|nr:hypothetical protein NQ314_004987 [Rhamnusium bicolor]